MRRWLSILLVIVLLLSCNCRTVIACDENQTNDCVTQILFGSEARSHANDEKVKMLMSALYLCSEQSDGQGENKLNYLINKKVSKLPSFEQVNIPNDDLAKCSHTKWDSIGVPGPSEKRRDLLRNSVNRVFDFGTFNNLFGSKKGKCNSFAALLYYWHILADYLEYDPSDTRVKINGRLVEPYKGEGYSIINNNQPSFTEEQKRSLESFAKYSELDRWGRAGVVFANIGPDILANVGKRKNIQHIKPSGWNDYSGYERTHLYAHYLGGVDEKINLITGTDELNVKQMKEIENKVFECINKYGYHVLYRVTPHYEKDNLLATGVQIEAYSVEDGGEKCQYNVYCYNIELGKTINYRTGENRDDILYQKKNDVLPFAVSNASEEDPDLIFEMNKYIDLTFNDLEGTNTYKEMNNKLMGISKSARNVAGKGDNEDARYCNLELRANMKEYFETLCTYIPLLLREEDFFKSAFN